MLVKFISSSAMVGYPGWSHHQTKEVDERTGNRLLTNHPSSFVQMDPPKPVVEEKAVEPEKNKSMKSDKKK